MKIINWNPEKNQLLKKLRGVCFEDIIFYIENNNILGDYNHPNTEKYPNQRIMVIFFNDYVWLVPYVENEKELFLKTIIPSRKAKEKFLGEIKNEKTSI